MAGHSKWKNIRLRKGKQDAIRGKMFTKLGREIIVAARMGGGDPGTNPRLRVAIQKARENAVPNDNIQRAIDKGTGAVEGENYEEMTYEGYGPGGVAIMIECYTENKNRTVPELRHAFSKHGGNLAENGSVSWQFNHVGEISVAAEGLDEEEFTLTAIDAGADDVEKDDEGNFLVRTAIENLHSTNDALENAGIKTNEVGLTYIATNKATPADDDWPKLLKLLDMLDELDDVKETYINVDIPEEMMSED
ncbi:MAG: YebC/PmpR family DNA-binding transcriptional regulator [Fimbriimonadaceae bacterium]|nr:YebC/PmpR family DNA-binding transcriptional regulator [Fimbriimonadaceae bacterium]